MINLKLKNSSIILMPITNEEKLLLENNFMNNEDIYVLYRLPDLNGIHIGMVSSLMKNYFPTTANVGTLNDAISKSFFYNGGSNLANNASKITDRPVYRIKPSDDRMVLDYEVLNNTSENGLNINLEDIVDGHYTLNAEKSSVLKK